MKIKDVYKDTSISDIIRYYNDYIEKNGHISMEDWLELDYVPNQRCTKGDIFQIDNTYIHIVLDVDYANGMYRTFQINLKDIRADSNVTSLHDKNMKVIGHIDRNLSN